MAAMPLPDNFTIEPATAQDSATILSLIKALAEYEKLSHEVVATEASVQESLFGARRGAGVIFARVAGEAVGFAVWFHNYSTFLSRPGLYLEDLFVLPPWRGRGIGRALLVHLAQMAVERGCGRMEWSVLDWNEPAIGFYKQLGAKPMDEWTTFRLTGDALARLATEHQPRA
jgi:GNAT superfamily N-acetyltransferase